MRPVVKRTDKPRALVEHRPQIIMTDIKSKPAAKILPAKQPERPVIPIKKQ
jgi:hypothetical protein